MLRGRMGNRLVGVVTMVSGRLSRRSSRESPSWNTLRIPGDHAPGLPASMDTCPLHPLIFLRNHGSLRREPPCGCSTAWSSMPELLARLASIRSTSNGSRVKGQSYRDPRCRHGVQSLKLLDVRRTRVSPVEVEKFRAALPDCKVRH